MLVLLTSLPINSFEDAWQVVEDYEHRWLIEEYHKVIKSACSIESHALRTSRPPGTIDWHDQCPRHKIVSVETDRAQSPNAKAVTHVPTSWLKCIKLARPKLTLTSLTVYEFFRELAKQGGFLGRKHDDEPGWITIWRGFQKMHSLLDACVSLMQFNVESCG